MRIKLTVIIASLVLPIFGDLLSYYIYFEIYIARNLPSAIIICLLIIS